MSDGATAAPEALAAFEQTTEYANYFVTYGFLYHQKQMLEDHSRMVSYRDAILGNRERFEGKVVLDVGTGSGVLAIWSAQAGARKVYAGASRRRPVHRSAWAALTARAPRTPSTRLALPGRTRLQSRPRTRPSTHAWWWLRTA